MLFVKQTVDIDMSIRYRYVCISSCNYGILWSMFSYILI